MAESMHRAEKSYIAEEDVYKRQAFHQKDELGRPSVKNYSTLFLGYPFYETKDKTRVRFETGKLNAVHAFGDDSLPRHGLYRWHILDPIAFSEDIKVTLQQIGNDDLSLFERSDDVATVAYCCLFYTSTDLMGGSVNQKVVPYAQKENVFLIAGFNLPLILELAMNEDKVTKEELLDSIEESRKNMMLVQVEIPEGKKEDEEEFLA